MAKRTAESFGLLSETGELAGEFFTIASLLNTIGTRKSTINISYFDGQKKPGEKLSGINISREVANYHELLKPLTFSIIEHWNEEKMKEAVFVLNAFNNPQQSQYNQIYKF